MFFLLRHSSSAGASLPGPQRVSYLPLPSLLSSAVSPSISELHYAVGRFWELRFSTVSPISATTQILGAPVLHCWKNRPLDLRFSTLKHRSSKLVHSVISIKDFGGYLHPESLSTVIHCCTSCCF